MKTLIKALVLTILFTAPLNGQQIQKLMVTDSNVVHVLDYQYLHQTKIYEPIIIPYRCSVVIHTEEQLLLELRSATCGTFIILNTYHRHYLGLMCNPGIYYLNVTGYRNQTFTISLLI